MKKHLLIPVSLIVLSLLFLFFSFLVYISRNKASLIKKKLRIGALLLGMTGLSLSSCSTPPMRTCYKPAYDLMFAIHTKSTSLQQRKVIKLMLPRQHTIKGQIRDIYTQFSFCLHQGNKIISKGNLLKAQRKMQHNRPIDFMITLDKNTPTGSYSLSFYISAAEKITSENISGFFKQYNVKIIQK